MRDTALRSTRLLQGLTSTFECKRLRSRHCEAAVRPAPIDPMSRPARLLPHRRMTADDRPIGAMRLPRTTGIGATPAPRDAGLVLDLINKLAPTISSSVPCSRPQRGHVAQIRRPVIGLRQERVCSLGPRPDIPRYAFSLPAAGGVVTRRGGSGPPECCSDRSPASADRGSPGRHWQERSHGYILQDAIYLRGPHSDDCRCPGSPGSATKKRYRRRARGIASIPTVLLMSFYCGRWTLTKSPSSA